MGTDESPFFLMPSQTGCLLFATTRILTKRQLASFRLCRSDFCLLLLLLRGPRPLREEAPDPRQARPGAGTPPGRMPGLRSYTGILDLPEHVHSFSRLPGQFVRGSLSSPSASALRWK